MWIIYVKVCPQNGMQETEALSHLKTFYDQKNLRFDVVVVFVPATFMKKVPETTKWNKKVVLCIETFSYVAVVSNARGKLIKFYEMPERQTKQKSNEKSLYCFDKYLQALRCRSSFSSHTNMRLFSAWILQRTFLNSIKLILMSQSIPFALLNIQVSQLNRGFVRCVFFCMINQIWNVFDMKLFVCRLELVRKRRKSIKSQIFWCAHWVWSVQSSCGSISIIESLWMMSNFFYELSWIF